MNLDAIELRKLHHVVVLARARSFIKAAEELRLTQPALTRSIQSIEARFSVRLFDRERAGVTLTAVGREFLRRAQSLLIEANDLTRFAERTGKGEAGELAFGLSPLPAKLFLSAVAIDLFATRPALGCSVAVRDPLDLVELLISDKIEFFLAAETPESPNATLEVEELVALPKVFAVRAGHPLLDRRRVTMQDLEAYPLLVGLFEPGARATPSLARHPAKLQSDDYNALKRITLHSNAVWSTVMPFTSDDDDETPALVSLPLSDAQDSPNATIKAVTLARRTLSPAARYVLADLRRRCAGVGGWGQLHGETAPRNSALATI
jgi:DNA-binding transcriptional LysR family regulator